MSESEGEEVNHCWLYYEADEKILRKYLMFILILVVISVKAV